MKKILLSTVVVLSFLFYALTQRKNVNSSLSVNTINTAVPPTVTSGITIMPSITNGVTTQPRATNTTIPNPPTAVPTAKSGFKDGTFTGSVADAFYGNIQVAAVISGGKITDVTFLQYPNDRGRSIEINSQAMPMLRSEAITAQSGNVDIISGATDTSQAFVQSMSDALQQAKQ